MPIGNLLGCWKHVYMYYCCQILPIVDQLASQWYGINFTNSPNSTCTYETVSHLRSKSTTNNAHTLVDPIPLSFSPISMHPTKQKKNKPNKKTLLIPPSCVELDQIFKWYRLFIYVYKLNFIIYYCNYNAYNECKLIKTVATLLF